MVMPPRDKPKPKGESVDGSDEKSIEASDETLHCKPDSRPGLSSGSSTSLHTSADAHSQTREPTVEPPASSKASIKSKASINSINQLNGEQGELRRKASGRLWKNGNWNTKAAPVAEVALESIGATSDPKVSRKGSSTSLSSAYLSRSVKGNTKSQKVSSTQRPVSAVSLNTEAQKQTAANDEIKKDAPQLPAAGTTSDKENEVMAKSGTSASEPENQKTSQESSSNAQMSTWGWRGWWSKPDTQPSEVSQSKSQEVKVPSEPSSPEIKEDIHGKSASIASSVANPLKDPNHKKGETASVNESAPNDVSSQTSWFWRWSTQQNMQNSTSTPTSAVQDKAEEGPARNIEKALDQQSVKSPNVNSLDKTKGQKTSGWAFWSSQRSDGKESGATQKQVGELAVSNTPSQTKPEAAQFNEQKIDNDKDKKFKVRSSDKATNEKKIKSTAITQPQRGEEPDAPLKPAETPKPPLTSQSHLLLPNFGETFASIQSPTYWQQLRSWIYGTETRQKHLSIAVAPPKIKNALAIGIHGFFPASIVQRVIGQPTGTSIRFANMGAEAIADWTKARGYKCKIEKVALEGEGMIADRVDTLWKLLLNWVDHIRKSDFVLITCHSQGVPVSVMLLSKLLEFGCLSSSARVGICAMAGINLGPFGDFKSKLFGATASELFEFSRQNSAVSMRHLGSLERCLRHGVRIVYTASLDDQLVSLEVGLACPK